MIKDRLRTLLNIRVKREGATMGAKPRAGSKITLAGMRMQVTESPVDELWYFFSLQGWREIIHPRDRRKYLDLPLVSFELLARCSSGEREVRYRQMIAAAMRSRAAANVPLSATAGTTGPSRKVR